VPDDDEKTYTKERLIEESQGFLGVPRHVAAGALRNAPKDMAVSHAKDLVRSWKSREIGQKG
jgi:hypothetical protein